MARGRGTWSCRPPPCCCGATSACTRQASRCGTSATSQRWGGRLHAHNGKPAWGAVLRGRIAAAPEGWLFWRRAGLPGQLRISEGGGRASLAVVSGAAAGKTLAAHQPAWAWHLDTWLCTQGLYDCLAAPDCVPVCSRLRACLLPLFGCLQDAPTLHLSYHEGEPLLSCPCLPWRCQPLPALSLPALRTGLHTALLPACRAHTA